MRALAAAGTTLAPEVGEGEVEHRERLDTALMALFRETRREDVFEALYEHSRAGLHGWIRAHARGLDPFELLQDTFVNVYRYAGSFRDERSSSFRVWVRTIAANLIRRRRHDRRRVSLQALPEGFQEPIDEGLGPAARAQEVEEDDDLRRAWSLLLHAYLTACRDLAPRDRRALELVEARGLTYAEASRELGVRLSNMKMIIFRSRRRIRARMRAVLSGVPAQAQRLAG